MKCPNCGRTTPDNQSYCSYCGIPLNYATKSGNKKKRKNYKPYIVFAISAVIVLALMSLNPFKSFEKEKTEGTDEKRVDNAPETAGSIEVQTAGSGDLIDPEIVKNTVSVNANIPLDAFVSEGHSYYIFDNGCESWDEAEGYCESRGGYLAVINSSEENELLFDYMRRSGYDEVFMGYTDERVENHWEWVSGKKSGFTDWGINDEGSVEPNATNEREDWAHMNSSMHAGHWNDKEFGVKTSSYFCEWDLVNYLGSDERRQAEADAPIRADARDDADELLKLDENEQVKLLFSLITDNGETWYYVQHRTGAVGYIRSDLLVDAVR